MKYNKTHKIKNNLKKTKIFKDNIILASNCTKNTIFANKTSNIINHKFQNNNSINISVIITAKIVVCTAAAPVSATLLTPLSPAATVLA